jgi:hypothetical protein
MLPEFGSRAVLHQTAFLKRLNATVFLIVQSAVNRLGLPRGRLNAGVNGRRAMLVKPSSTVLPVRAA